MTDKHWEAPFGFTLQDAYYDVMDKLSDQWREFARKGLELDYEIADITYDYDKEGRREQKFQMCKAWERKLGMLASVEHLYDLLNYFLWPEDFPSKPTAMLQPEKGLPDKVMLYCSRVGKIEVVFESDRKSSKDFLPAYEKRYGKGKVIIINNVHFDPCSRLSTRNGSEVDVKNMRKLWTELGCEVDTLRNKTAETIFQNLLLFRESQTESFDYVVFIISSHGEDDRIFGYDGKLLKVSEILDIFNNENAPGLRGIPKLFFFQAARGRRVHKGVPNLKNLQLEESTTTSEPLSPDNKNDEKDSENDSQTEKKEEKISAFGYVKDEEKIPSRSSENEILQREILPVVSDMLVCYPTLRGYYSFQNIKNGSWFLNAVTNVFMKHAKSEHVLDLMVKVNDAVAKKSSSTGVPELDNCKCMPEFECTLRKKLYL